MIRFGVMAAAFVLAVPAFGQSIWQPLEAQPPARVQGPEMASGTEVTLRALDKVSGAVEDLVLAVGDSATYGRVTMTLTACRYPVDNPSSDAFAFLTIEDSQDHERLFQGWMIASSPALNALDHPRYDVWVLRCR